MNTEKSVVEQAADALRLWSNAWNEFDKTGKNKPETIEEVIAPFIEMEKEQKEPLVNYIKDVRDVCGKHYHPTETELHYLSIRAENILATFKSE